MQCPRHQRERASRSGSRPVREAPATTLDWMPQAMSHHNAAAGSNYPVSVTSSTAAALVVASRATAATDAHSLNEVADVVNRALGDSVDDAVFSQIVDLLADICHGCGLRLCGCNLAVA